MVSVHFIDGFIYHDIDRGNNFADDSNHRAYLKAIAKTKERYPFRLLGYCPRPTTSTSTWPPARRRAVDRPNPPIAHRGSYVATSQATSHHRPCVARAFQEPGHPGQRPLAGGAALRRGQSAPGEDGDLPERIPLVELPLPRDGRERPLAASSAGVGAARADVQVAVQPVASSGRRGGVGEGPGRTILASVQSSRPFWSAEWFGETAKRLGIDLDSIRSRERPRKRGLDLAA